ncbi:MAG: phosphatase PAP2 family protein [Candidatus Brocadiia bacterium]|nr:MAG: phosphatase PAP2 family protein [Candidatus Brocadiia bacterium]
MVNFKNINVLRRLLVLAIVAITAGCPGCNRPGSQPAAVPGFTPGLVAGYLSAKTFPNSLVLLPPPPARGSATLAQDEEISRRSFNLRDTARWLLAGSDADLTFPHAAGTFSCALNAPITEKDTPRLYLLLRRTLTDVGLSTYAAKNRYNRARPFLWNRKPICTPNDRAHLEKDGSYPSGHAAVGWGWALILSEISPEQTDVILARGMAFGESRNVCNAHWHSDVVQGRIIAAGTVARLHAEPSFRADLATARAELAAIRKKGLKPTRNCDSEAAALAIRPSLAQ